MYKKINYNQFRENWKWYIQKGCPRQSNKFKIYKYSSRILSIDTCLERL